MSEPNAEQALSGITETIKQVQKEATLISDTTNPSQATEQAPSQPSNDSGGVQIKSTEKPLNGGDGMSESVEGKPETTVQGSESKKDEDGVKEAGETTAGVEQGDTTKEGQPAQIGEKRSHPEESADEKGDGEHGGEGTDAKKLKTDESKPEEEETETTKGKGGRRKSARKTTAAATAKTAANAEGKKRAGRPRKNAAAEKHVEEKDAGVEKMDTAPQPVAEHIN